MGPVPVPVGASSTQSTLLSAVMSQMTIPIEWSVFQPSIDSTVAVMVTLKCRDTRRRERGDQVLAVAGGVIGRGADLVAKRRPVHRPRPRGQAGVEAVVQPTAVLGRGVGIAQIADAVVVGLGAGVVLDLRAHSQTSPKRSPSSLA